MTPSGRSTSEKLRLLINGKTLTDEALGGVAAPARAALRAPRAVGTGPGGHGGRPVAGAEERKRGAEEKGQGP